MQRGDWVRLRAYGGEVITRRVVEVGGDMVVVCRDDEYQVAQREGREPVTVSFWKGYALGTGTGEFPNPSDAESAEG